MAVVLKTALLGSTRGKRQDRIEPLRLQPVPRPHSSDHHVREPELLSQLARAPVRGTIAGLALEGPFQDTGLELRGEGARTLARMAREQPRQPLLPEATAPTGDEGVIAIELIAALFPRVARDQQQDQPRVTCIVRATGVAIGSLTQLHTLCIREGDRARGHDHTIVLVVTGH